MKYLLLLLCLFSVSVHAGEQKVFFEGQEYIVESKGSNNIGGRSISLHAYSTKQEYYSGLIYNVRLLMSYGYEEKRVCDYYGMEEWKRKYDIVYARLNKIIEERGRNWSASFKQELLYRVEKRINAMKPQYTCIKQKVLVAYANSVCKGDCYHGMLDRDYQVIKEFVDGVFN